MLEEILAVVLQKRMVDMNRDHYDSFVGLTGPGGGLSSKIELFHAFGLCNDSLYKAMHDIRGIRNKFAHRIEPLTFDEPEIAALVDRLAPTHFDAPSRRQKFIGLLTLVLSLVYATGVDDIRVKFIGETHAALYIDLLKRDGTLTMVGAPEQPLPITVFGLLMKRRQLAGSSIGGTRETQEMLDFCAEHNITCDVEVIRAQQINEAYERLLKSDVKYRFVIDIASLQ